MSHVRRAVACAGALAVTCFSFALSVAPSANAVDPASKTTADAAVSWLVANQQSDGGFELAQFPGFETRDASLAIAEAAQTGGTWSPSQTSPLSRTIAGAAIGSSEPRVTARSPTRSGAVAEGTNSRSATRSRSAAIPSKGRTTNTPPADPWHAL